MNNSPPPIDLSAPFVEQLDRKHRIARFFVLTLFAIALTGGLVITQISVKRGLIVYSSPTDHWVPGRQIVIRAEGRSLPFRQSIQLQDARVLIKHKDGLKPLKSQELRPALEQMWQGVITLPQTPGKYQMVIEAEGFEQPSATKGERSILPVKLNAHLEFELNNGARSSPIWPPLAQTPTTARERRGEGTLSFYPADQRLTSELPSTLYVIGQSESGQPLSETVKFTLLEGLLSEPLPQEITLNRQGIASLIITPKSMGLRISAESHLGSEVDSSTSSDERFNPRAHQFNLIPQARVVKSSGEISIEVQSTYPTDRLYIDLWWGGHWLSTDTVHMVDTSRKRSTGGLKSTGLIQLSIPDLPLLKTETPQLIWLQSYLLPYQIDEVRGGAYLLWSPPTWNAERLARWLLERIELSEMEPSQYWRHLPLDQLLTGDLLRLALGRIARPPANPEVIINSGESAQITAQRHRSGYMQLYLEFMAGLCLMTMVWLVTLVSITYKRQISSPEWSDPASVRQARKVAIAWIAPMLLLLLVFFGAMVLLVFKVSW